MIPIAKPRPSRNQPATIFIPGGYTPARAAPVTRRSAIPTTRVGAIATPSVASPATTADAWTSRRADQMSLSVSIADTSAPTTKPSCTEMVSQAAPAGPSCHRRESVGATAEALNHGAPGPDAPPPHLLGPERHDSRRRAQHGGELLLQSAA